MAILRSVCLVWALFFLPAQVVWAQESERLHYRVYYQGLLSAMARVSIADVQLDTASHADNAWHIGTLSLSSSAHDLMDTFYPIRYRLRAIYARRAGQVYAFETYKQTRKVQHDLVWVDGRAGSAHRLKADQQGEAELPDDLRPWLMGAAYRSRGKEALAVPTGVLDQLSLLQILRERPPPPGQVLQLQVTDGKKHLDYRVTGEASEALVIDGQLRDCRRLRVEGFKQERDDEGNQLRDHAPILVWLSSDPQRIPVRFYSDLGLGTFTVEWVSPERATVVEVAIREQPLEAEPVSPFLEDY